MRARARYERREPRQRVERIEGDRGRSVSAAGIVLLFAVLQCGFFAWVSWNHPEAILGLYAGLVVLVTAGVGCLVQHVDEAELRTREQILRSTLAQMHH